MWSGGIDGRMNIKKSRLGFFFLKKKKIYVSKGFYLFIYLFIFNLYIVGSKNLAAPTHFIQGLRPMPRRKKRSMMNKESPSCQETSPRTILSSANQNCKKEERHALKDSLSGHLKQKGLAQRASHESKVEEQF